jgi:hypothetical protein
VRVIDTCRASLEMEANLVEVADKESEDSHDECSHHVRHSHSLPSAVSYRVTLFLFVRAKHSRNLSYHSHSFIFARLNALNGCEKNFVG